MKEEKRTWKQTAGLLWELFASYFKVGLFTIGGGIAMLPLIADFAVKKKGWMSEEEMIDCLAVCQSLPGVVSINTATWIGKRMCGFKGSLAATLGAVLPSFTIIILAVLLLAQIQDNPYVTGAFEGAKAAAAALVLLTCIRLGKKVLKEPMDWIIAIAAFVLIIVLKVSALWAILGGALTGLLLFTARLLRGRWKVRKEGRP